MHAGKASKIVFAAVLAALAAGPGCQLTDENPNWAPTQDYPSWAYDAPFYYRPTDEPQPDEVTGDCIPVYHEDSHSLFIRHPGGHQLPGVPRMAVWLSDDEGQTWDRAGYFGVEQTHFLAHAETDGPLWVRLVGPGREPPGTLPVEPHRVYVADTRRPAIEVTVDPPPVEKDEAGREVPRLYRVGEKVTVRWAVRDENLIPETVRLLTTFSRFPRQAAWSPFPMPQEPTGRMELTVPSEAAGGDSGPAADSASDGRGLRFCVAARDKAGNLGLGFSEALAVAAGEGAACPLPGQRDCWPDSVVGSPRHSRAAQDHGTPAGRDGWPDAGALLRGGRTRKLRWLPETAAGRRNVRLEFSDNNGRSWMVVAGDLPIGPTGRAAGKAVTWTVPRVNSRICRLRVVSRETPRLRLMHAESRPFTVHTPPPDTFLGPEPLPVLDERNGEAAPVVGPDGTPVRGPETAPAE
jgi:hypothetical protein